MSLDYNPTECNLRGSGGPEIDPKCEELHPEAKLIFVTSNNKYREIEDRHFEKICINSGKRSVDEQVLLYHAFKFYQLYGGPSAHAADNPGYSKHEYGIAIDIIRIGDEERLRAVLETSGWARHADEAWHYNANDLESLAVINAKRVEIRDRHFSIKQLILDHCGFQNSLNQLETEHSIERQELRRLNNQKRRLLRLIARTERRVRVLETDLREVEDEIRENQSQVRERQSALDNFRYTTCPEDNPLPQCNSDAHEPERSEYFRQRRRLQSLVNEAREDLVENMDYRGDVQRELRQALSILQRREQQLEEIQEELMIQTRRVERLSENIGLIRDDMRNKWGLIIAKASQIQLEIDDFLDSSFDTKV